MYFPPDRFELYMKEDVEDIMPHLLNVVGLLLNSVMVDRKYMWKVMMIKLSVTTEWLY